MGHGRAWLGVAFAALAVALAGCGAEPLDGEDESEEAPLSGPSKVRPRSDGILLVNGRPMFPIGVSLPPPPDERAPSGRSSFAELRHAGINFLRTGPANTGYWSESDLQNELAVEAAAARYNLRCFVYLGSNAVLKANEPPDHVSMLRRVIESLRESPALAAWKGADEPQWGNVDIPSLLRARSSIRKLDPYHPLGLIEAARGTVADLQPYSAASDITGMDVMPVSIPVDPGLSNKDISVVGDMTRLMREVSAPNQGPWMVLQIASTGSVIPPDKRNLPPRATERLQKKFKKVFPTFLKERFMTYDALINGARGLFFFGGQIPDAWTTDDDRRLKWAWHYWPIVERVVSEIREGGPLYEALLVPQSGASSPIRLVGRNVEHTIRRVGRSTYVLAANRSPSQRERIEFDHVPGENVEVLFEDRTIPTHDGHFADGFDPHEVHVYRIHEP
jgi:hypothetical protein